jgi:hypothetical protein
MSDVEHELIGDMSEARAEIERLRALAARALAAAACAQDAVDGRHDAWIDDALRDVS